MAAPFPQQALTELLSQLIFPDIPIERIRFLEREALKFPHLLSSPQMHYESRTELLNRSARQAVAYKHFVAKYSVKGRELVIPLEMFAAHSMVGVQAYFSIATFALQASEAQKAKYLAKIESYEINLAYAQTELGHGSNVRGIETTVTYEPSFEGFVVHSPTVAATK